MDYKTYEKRLAVILSELCSLSEEVFDSGSCSEMCLSVKTIRSVVASHCNHFSSVLYGA